MAKQQHEEKPWKCEDGHHVLGMTRRNGSGVRQLLLYRQAVDLDAEEMAEVDVIAVVEGYVMDVRCSICGQTRTWIPGQESLDRLIQQARRSRSPG